MVIYLWFIFLTLIHPSEERCSGNAKICQWIQWQGWQSCSTTCGGGYRHRYRQACCHMHGDKVEPYDECMRRCGMNSDDADDYSSCNNICYNSGRFQYDAGSRHYSYGHCICTPKYGGTCCDEPLCGWDGRWCWPGACVYNNYERYCICDSGFRKEKVGSKTMCQLVKTPILQTCRAGLENVNGDAVNTTGTGNCSEAQSVYTHLQPHRLSFTITSSFSITVSSNPSANRIRRWMFGIVANSIEVLKRNIKDDKQHLSEHVYNRGPECDNAFSDKNPRQMASCTGNLVPGQILRNGESICVNFVPFAGGHLTPLGSETEIYKRTKTNRELCFMYDNQAPIHCAGSSCITSMLHLTRRITSTPNITASFASWRDPVPNGGRSTKTSGIKKFVASFLRVEGLDKTTMVMKYPGSSMTEVSAHGTEVSFTLPTEPALYAVLLEVHDIAGNVQMARRFVLYDNSSKVAVLSKQLLKSTTASAKTNYTWQVHHGSTCLNWTGRYYNTYHTNINLLRKIKSDGNISSSYDQTDGPLPVSGTPNVDGIVRFEYTWKIDNGKFKAYSSVSDIYSQSFCENLSPTDGQTYTFKIKPIDINSRVLTENLVVHIDRSPPSIDNIWVVKDGYKQLFVHNSSDLSKMSLQFEALDLHSGLHSVVWKLGTSDGANDLGEGSVGVHRTNGSCTDADDKCYCPKVGLCEQFLYTIDLNSLVAKNTNEGQHNRNYYFSVIVTNNAKLVNIEHLDVLADDSPPEEGVVQEGVTGSPDIDYTSESEITVNWHGFIDHESGIKFYRVGLSDRCLSRDELDVAEFSSNSTIVVETKGEEWKFKVVKDGYYISSIVAYNNAMEPSKVVCSDGITKDSTVPSIVNVTLKHSKVMEVFACDISGSWFVRSDLKKVALIPTDTCTKRCADSRFAFLKNLPEIIVNSTENDIANHLCSNLPDVSENWYIYIPSNNIDISWVSLDDNSQIRREEIGIASDPSSSSSPDIEIYRDTHGHSRYHNVHEGIDRGLPFYFLIKTTNKAGLENILPLGPVIIDDTPPEIKGVLNIHIENDDDKIYCSWDNDTFIDPEQKHAVDYVLFKIGVDDRFYTPLLQIPSAQKCIHRDLPYCVHYPISKLQRQDEEKGLQFHFELYVYNMAGHFTTVRSPTFTLPSQFRPGHGHVFDVDPSAMQPEQTKMSNTPQDMDVHFSVGTVCAVWTGFNHHKNVTFQVGVGTQQTVVDIISYKTVENTDQLVCLNSSALAPYRKYFVTINATCSGGSRIVSSNGITIIDRMNIEEAFGVNIGTCCDSVRHYPLEKRTYKDDAVVNFTSYIPLQVGHGYTIESEYKLGFNQVISNDVVWMNESNFNSRMFRRRFRAFRQTVSFSVSTDNQSEKELLNMTLLDCFENLRITDTAEFLEVTLSLHKNFSHLATKYKASVFKDDCTTDIHANTSCLQKIPETEISSMALVFQIGNLSLMEGQAYRVGVNVCFRQNCMPPIFSNTVYVQPGSPVTSLLSAVAAPAKDNETCLKVSVDWERFNCLRELPTTEKYEWALSLDQYTDGLLTTWFPVVTDNYTITSLLVQNCVDVPVYLHRPMYACIKTMCESGTTSTTCTLLDMPHPNEYNKQHVYELDASNPHLEDIKKNLHAEFLGDTLPLLHKSDLDFCRKDTLLLGAIPNSSERDITWYLLTDQNIPMRSCESSTNCVKTVTATGGHVALHKTKLIPGKKYYICATSNRTVIQRELFEDILEEIHTCGNGFVVDDVPPTAGQVTIMNQHQNYMLSPNEMIISWKGFQDRLALSYSNVTSSIYSYSYAIGTSPGGVDVVPYTSAGLSRTVTAKHLHLRNGATFYATIRAWDQVNYSVDAVSAPVGVDFTPPTSGDVTVGSALKHKYVMSTKNLHVYWNGFEDKESGISHFYLGIGDELGLDNVLAFREIRDQYADMSRNVLKDGLTYYVVLKVVNKAGLWTTVSSDQFILDSSPPVRGVVRDGGRFLPSDVDYQNFTKSLTCHWEAFDDPHSGIMFYRVGLGTDPGQFDIHMLTGVGLRTEITWHSKLKSGEKYFATVEACNGAGLCTRHHSDGIILDDSAPVPGKIHLGISGKHETYQNQRNSISAHWVGFEDPQSDIHHFEWCITLQKNACDIFPFTNILLSKSVFKTQLYLPLKKDIFVKLKTYNNVGMYTEAISDSFKVDNSHPVIKTRPYFVLENMQISSQTDTQWENSLIRLRWKYSDPDSPIVKHVVRLGTHHDGKVRKENLQLGNEDRITIQMQENDLLLDGDRYWATVTACNAAGLCTNSTSDDLLIDSSPPYLGGFKPPMTWQNEVNGTRVHLTWYGFSDIESGIAKYMVSASKYYSGSDLSNGTIAFEAKETKEQTCSVLLQDHISDGDSVILSIWALNGVGLRSGIGKVTVTAVQTDTTGEKGILKLQKHSCIQHYCNRDCTCAVVGGKCEKRDNNMTCETVHNDSQYQSIHVLVGMLQDHQAITASSSCLTSHWIPEENETKVQIQRYEWSIGIDKPGDGVFDGSYTKEWFDVDLQTDMTYCMPDTLQLVHGEQYTVFVNAWYSERVSQMFSSLPVTIDTTPPDIVRGKYIIISADDCASNIYFIKNVTSVQLCWQNVFRDRISGILKYYVMAGSSPHGDDLIPVANYGLNTKAVFNHLPMQPGTKYFFTVRALNTVGLMTSLASDGIVLDIESPFVGIVFNTDHHRNIHFQASLDSFSASWHGFGDHHSYIHHYSVWIIETGTGRVVHIKDNVGIETSVVFDDTKLQHGESYRFSVQALDAAGYESLVVDSETFTVDATPPHSFRCKAFKQIESLNDSTLSSTDIHFSAILQKNTFYKVIIGVDNLDHLSSVEVSISQHLMTVPMAENADESKESELSFLSPYNGNTSFTIGFGAPVKNDSVHIHLLQCTDMDFENVTFPIDVMQISHSLLSVCSRILDPESGITSVEVGVGTSKGGFQIYPLSSVPVENHVVIEHNSPHGATLYVTAVAHNSAGLEAVFSSMKIVVDHTPPEIQNIIANLIIYELENRTNESLANITVNADVRDTESGIKACSCFLESRTVNGLLLSANGTESFHCLFSDFSIMHGTTVQPSIICTNNVELIMRKTSPRLLASFLPPSSADAHLHVVSDNEVSYKDGEFYLGNNETIQSNRSKVHASWSGFRDVTGIDHYEYTLLEGTTVVTKRTEPDSRSTAMITGLAMKDGLIYTLSVEAVNVGGIHSSPVLTSFKVESKKPQFTGGSVKLYIGKDGSRVMDWGNVFIRVDEMAIIFDINIGSREGFCDIINRMETMTTYTVLPETQSYSVWIAVCARYITGRGNCYYQTLVL